MSEIITTNVLRDKNGVSVQLTGLNGADGADGYTPVKGVDYWTEADQESIVQQVIAALGTPVFGTVDADNNIVLSGDLANGTYAFKYEGADGTQTEIGTVEVGSTEDSGDDNTGDTGGGDTATYTNLFAPDTATINTRMSGGSSTSKAADGYVMTAAITIPETTIAGTTAGDVYIAVPASMWANSANLFTCKNGETYGYMSCSATPGTTEGNWTKLYLCDEWGQAHTTDAVIISLYVSASAITAADIANIAIYYNECPV